MNTPTSEVLHLAADLIERRGWTHGVDGWSGWSGDTGPLCIEGAIDAALGGVRDESIFKFWACPAHKAVGDYLERDMSINRATHHIAEPLWQWNDAYSDATGFVRTQSEVVEVLRAAAAVEAAREDSSLLAEMGRA